MLSTFTNLSTYISNGAPFPSHISRTDSSARLIQCSSNTVLVLHHPVTHASARCASNAERLEAQVRHPGDASNEHRKGSNDRDKPPSADGDASFAKTGRQSGRPVLCGGTASIEAFFQARRRSAAAILACSARHRSGGKDAEACERTLL